MRRRLTLVSHVLCPYVQRAAIVLQEKGATYERRDVDLSQKPDWFLAVSPLGKTPVLLVDQEPIFESAVICEFLDETIGPRLHSDDPLTRARHRSWIEFASAVLNTIAGLYNASDRAGLAVKVEALRRQFEQVERALVSGPFFAADAFSIVDAAFAPVFRYFDVFDEIENFGVLSDLPKVTAWRANLRSRPSVRAAAPADYPQKLRDFLLARGSEMSARMQVGQESAQ